MPHGYTNDTARDGRTVVKDYLGPDAALRRDTEARALTALAGRPVAGPAGDHRLLDAVSADPRGWGRILIPAG